jgi:hypothetical protein
MVGMIGPVSSGYPGKYPFYGFAIFVACLHGVELVHFYKKRKSISKEVSTRSKETILKEVFGRRNYLSWNILRVAHRHCSLEHLYAQALLIRNGCWRLSRSVG